MNLPLPGNWRRGFPLNRGESEVARAIDIVAVEANVRQRPARIRQPGGAGLARAGPHRARGPLHPHRRVAILVAFGQGSHEADQQGALQLLAGQPYGLVSLWLLGIGFAGYALWRLSEAVFGVTGEGNGAGPRLKSLVRAVMYAIFAVLTVKVIAGQQASQAVSRRT